LEKAIIERFISGTASPDEVRKVLKWYYSDDAEHLMSENIEYLWQAAEKEGVTSQFEKSETLESIRQRLKDQPRFRSLPDHAHSSDARKFDLTFNLKVAASILLIFTIGWMIFQWSDGLVVNQSEALVIQTEIITKATAKGQKYTLFLEDGTRVKLNSESQLQFESKFSDSARVVYLTGEAYFEVQEDPQRPFTVYSGDIATTALGTSFNVHAHAKEEQVKISLVSGKVRVDKTSASGPFNQPELILTPGLQAIYSSNENSLVKQPFEPQKHLAWKDGILYFEDASWSRIVKQLESWYGVEIIVENAYKSARKPYTGTFADQSLENVLESLSFTKGFNFRIDAPKVYVEFK